MLLTLGTASAHDNSPEAQRVLLPPDRPEQIIVATNFGLIFSDDGGESWLFSCEHGLSNYASPYLLGPEPPDRIFGMTAGGLIYSDDDACTWTASGGSMAEVQPFAFAVDTSNSKRVYAIGAPSADLRAGDSIYVSDDSGLSFSEPKYTAPPGSALLTLAVAPSQPSTVYATMLSVPDNYPILIRSVDSGEHWEMVANLLGSLGRSPFELLAVDPTDANKLYAKVLGLSAETLAISDNGGLSFTLSVSIQGSLNAFIQLASGTILLGGTEGTEGVAYRSLDAAQSFEPWPEAPHIHALAERDGKLYVGADNFADGYVVAVSEDEGTQLTPLMAFDEVQRVKSCVADACVEACAYYAGINLWPATVCGDPPDSGPEPRDAGLVKDAGVPDAPSQSDAAVDAGPASDAGAADETGDASVDAGVNHASDGGAQPKPRRSKMQLAGGGCACGLAQPSSTSGWLWLLSLGFLASLACRGRASQRC